jgi:Sulphur transport
MFLSAAAVSSITIQFMSSRKWIEIKHSPSTWAKNFVGGALLGVAMYATGACMFPHPSCLFCFIFILFLYYFI